MLPDNQYPITEAQFRTWLQQNAAQVVGVPCNSKLCPLFNAVAAITGKPPMMVNSSVLVRHGGGVLNHPTWVRDFIWNLDVSHAKTTGFPVTGNEALECLVEIER